jgi:hypothetical protein
MSKAGERLINAAREMVSIARGEADPETYRIHTPEMIELRAENERLRAALEPLLKRYVTLASSGDCGFWNPEEENEVISARAALRSVENTWTPANPA